jgi:hypothetical protein
MGVSTVPDAEDCCNKLKAAGQLITGPVAPPLDLEVKASTLKEWSEERHWWEWGESRFLSVHTLCKQLKRSDPSRPKVFETLC